LEMINYSIEIDTTRITAADNYFIDIILIDKETVFVEISDLEDNLINS